MFLSSFATKIFVFISCLSHVCRCPVHVIQLCLIILIKFDEQRNYEATHYAVLLELNCNFPHPPLTPYLFGLNILFSTPFSNSDESIHFPQGETPSLILLIHSKG